MKIDFIIIGAQKSATTFIQRGLVDHPEVSIPEGEAAFLIDEAALHASADTDVTAQASESKSTETGVLHGIKCADYLGHSEIAAYVSQRFPRAQLIVLLRDPVSRAFSAYHHNIRYGHLPVVEANEGLRHIFEGSWDVKYPVAAEIRSYGCYYKNLSEWMRHFDPEYFLILEQEGVFKDSLGSLRRVYRFLRIDEEHVSQNLDRRSQAVTYDLRRLRFLSLAGRFRRYCEGRMKEGTKFSSLYRMMDSLVWKGVAVVDRLLLSQIFGNSKTQLNPELKKKIRVYYEEDQKKLGDLFKLFREKKK